MKQIVEVNGSEIYMESEKKKEIRKKSNKINFKNKKGYY